MQQRESEDPMSRERPAGSAREERRRPSPGWRVSIVSHTQGTGTVSFHVRAGRFVNVQQSCGHIQPSAAVINYEAAWHVHVAIC